MSHRENPEAMLTIADAFAAMYEFLKIYKGELQDANVADVLSDTMPAYGGESADPGSWPMWLRAVEVVRDQHARPPTSSG
jgi:hypothetical protein